jgi:YndJ-like protein
LASAGVVLGVPLVAAGITLSAFGVGLVECAAAWLLAAAASLAGLLQFRAGASRGGLAGLLLGASSLALLTAMALAAAYALGAAAGADWLDIPQMYRFHGAVNAFGFALPALLAWHLIRKDEGGETVGVQPTVSPGAGIRAASAPPWRPSPRAG